jgi:hypothetical protein
MHEIVMVAALAAGVEDTTALLLLFLSLAHGTDRNQRLVFQRSSSVVQNYH